MSDNQTQKSDFDEVMAEAIYKELRDYAAKTAGVLISPDDPLVPIIVYQHKLFKDALNSQCERLKGENYVCLADFSVQESRMLQSYRKQVATTTKKSGEAAAEAFMEATEKERRRSEGHFKTLATEIQDTITQSTGRVKREQAFLWKTIWACTALNVAALLGNLFLLYTIFTK